jgi:gluconate 2-dehydrogenase gamma chain
MERREVLSFLGAAALAPLLAPFSAEQRWTLGESLHVRMAGGTRGRALSRARMALVVALADTILPKTDTPGAVEVGAPEFVDLLLAEWYPDDERRELVAGLDALDARCRSAQGAAFAELDPANRAAFVQTVDGRDGAKGSPEAAYAKLKDVIVFGYLTSKPIVPLVRRFPIIPGRFDGCIPV